MRKAAFLDRDGVVIEDPGFLDDPAGVAILPGVAEALVKLRSAGFLIVIVTNQSGIARGFLSEETLKEIHQRLSEELAAEGASIDDIRYCPHLPGGAVREYDVDCECRKPKPGMLLDAAEALGIDLAASYLVGDAERDVLAGRAAGCRTILVRSDGDGLGAATCADALADDLNSAAAMIFSMEGSECGPS